MASRFIAGAACAAIGLLCNSSAIAKSYKIELAPAAGQISRMDSGNRLVADKMAMTSATVMVSGEAQDSKRIVFSVGLVNTSQSPVDFGPENIKVCIADLPCRPVLTHEKMVKQIRRRSKRRAFAAALASGANGYAAGMSGTYSGRGTVTGAGQTYNYNYSGVDQASRQAATQDAARQAATNQRIIREQEKGRSSSLSGTLQTTTIDPGRYLTGLAFFDVPGEWKQRGAPTPIVFEISIDGETHRISGTIRKE